MNSDSPAHERGRGNLEPIRWAEEALAAFDYSRLVNLDNPREERVRAERELAWLEEYRRKALGVPHSEDAQLA